MKKNLTKTACFVILLLNMLCSTAQIIYTDIPDVTLKCTGNSCYKSHSLDINNDGTSDLSVLANRASNTSLDYNGNRLHYSYASVLIHYRILYGTSSQTKISVTDPYPSRLATVYINGSEIGSSANWDSDGVLSGNISYESFVTLKSYGKNNNAQPSSSGYWDTPEDRYLGIKISSNGQTYYGWVRLSVSVTNAPQATCIIKDYAYQSTPGVSILAGDIGAGSLTKPSPEIENEIKQSEIKISPNPIVSSATISFSLSKLEKVSLTIYDATGRLVKVVANKQMSEGNHQMELDVNEMKTGIYLLRLQSQSILQTKKVIVTR